MSKVKLVIRTVFYGILWLICAMATLLFAIYFVIAVGNYFEPESTLKPSDIAFSAVVVFAFGIASTIFWITLIDRPEKRVRPTHQGYVSWRNFARHRN